MAKVKGPLMSVEATGPLAGALSFQKNAGRNLVRGIRGQKVGQGVGQLAQRALYKGGTDYWQTFSDIEKEFWTNQAAGQRATGFNVYMKNYLKGTYPANVTEYTFEAPSRDASLEEQYPNTNYGGAVSVTCTPSPGYRRRSVLGWTYSPAQIPDNAEIIGARLRLWCFQSFPDPTPIVPLGIYAMQTTGFNESEVTWNDKDLMIPWNTPGGDFYSSDPDPASENPTPPEGFWIEWNVTDLVIKCIDDFAGFIDLMLRMITESVPPSCGYNFRSKDWSTASQRPKLIVKYLT